MREIKFRAWHEVNKVMYAHKDVPVLAKNLKSDNLWKYMQYTGLKDKNGVDIYEGDIVKVNDATTRREPLIAEVYYDTSVASFSGRCKDYPIDLFLHQPHSLQDYIPELRQYLTERTIEVIGNIYEHPHLLNTEK